MQLDLYLLMHYVPILFVGMYLLSLFWGDSETK